MGTYAVTGSASGMGNAVVERLQGLGHTVIGVDIRDADVVADLSTPTGRRSAADSVLVACAGRLDGAVLAAGLITLARTIPTIISSARDGLKGIGEALGAVFPATTLQTCIVHLIRNSLDFASWKDRKALAAAIKPIYTAVSAEAAQAELDAFEAGPWGQKFPTVVSAWRRASAGTAGTCR